jgi:hypothetical protein
MSMTAVFQRISRSSCLLWPSLETGLETSAACSRRQDLQFLSQRTSIKSVIKHDVAAVTGGREGEDDQRA